jgi:hypothetical protein
MRRELRRNGVQVNIKREYVRPVIAAVPIIGVNATAFIGQFSFMREHITSWPLAGIILLSATLESIAVYLAFEAHEAMRKGDSSGALRMGSYLFGAFIGILNYSHYAGPGFRPTFLAVATGLMSTSSAPLWGIYSRRIGRERLIELGLIEARSVKFARARWILWFRETFGAFRLAVWTGTQNPDEAIRAWEAREDAKRANANADAEREAAAEAERERLALAANPDTDRLSLAAMASKADRVRYALRSAPVGEASTYVAWLTDRGVTDVNAAYVRQIRSSESKRLATTARGKMRAISGGGVAP